MYINIIGTGVQHWVVISKIIIQLSILYINKYVHNYLYIVFLFA